MQQFSTFGQAKFHITENMHRWLRPAIVFGVLALSAAVAYLGTQDDFIMLIGLVALVIGVVLLLKIPELGFPALVGSMLITYDGPSHLNLTMVLVVGLFALWLVDVIFNRESLRLGMSRTFLPLGVLVAVSIVAFWLGQLAWIPFAVHAPLGAQAAGLSMFLLSAMVYFLAAQQMRNVRWLAWTVWLFIAIGTIYTLGEYVPLIGQFTGRFFSGFALGAMFWNWLVALSVGQAMFNRKLMLPARLAIGAVGLAVIANNLLIGQDWKSGWIPLLAVMGTFMALWSWHWLIPMGIGGAVAAGPAMRDLIASDSYSYSTRLDAWRIMWEIIKVNPLLGLGPANYHWYTPLYRIRGYAVQFNSHNQYVDIVAQIGFIGLAAYLWFFGAVLALGWRLRKLVPAGGFEQAYLFSVLAGLVGTLVAGMLGDWVVPFFYNITLGGFRASMLPWLFAGGLVALKNIAEQTE